MTSPTHIGNYQITERISVSDTTEVFKARLDGIGGFKRSFAIKRLLPTSDPGFTDTLVEEAKMAGLLSHANIVQIMDLGEHEGRWYVAMEYVDGPDLSLVLDRCSNKSITLPVPHAVFISVEALKGLEYAHNRQVMRGGRLVPLNIVHRDLAPSNVLVGFQGEVKLTDFGIGQASHQAHPDRPRRNDYLSPEQLSGRPVDQRSDVWNMGVLLYQMLTGRHPFAQDPQGELRPDDQVADLIREGRFDPPSHVNPDVPYPLEVVIEQALVVAPERRFQDATVMKEALDRFFHDAGFIFSHSTLAAFLKGLFPEFAHDGKPRQPAPAIDDQVTRPFNINSAPPTEEIIRPEPADPATVIRPIPSPLAPLADLSRSGALGPIAGIGDESTLIRNNPLQDDARAWSEAETVIKPDPAKSAPPQETVVPHPARAKAPPRPAPPTPAKPPRASRSYQVLYLALGAVVTLLVLFVGALIGLSAAQLLQPVPAGAPAVVKHDPEIEVHLPASAHLLVNGREVEGGALRRMFLPAGDHIIRVEQPPQQAVETRLHLVDNDLRILSFETLAPSTPEQER